MAEPDPRDPRVQAEKYLEQHKIPQLLESITSQLLFNQPPNPKEFIVRYLEKVQVTGTPPLYFQVDFETMFGMFDVTNRGVITAEQANAGLRSILGPTADLDLPPGKLLKKSDFVTLLNRTLLEASPYRRKGI